MPIFSLPSDFGIGTLGRDACDFIDFLAAADVHVWEIMPICHTDSSFSPHNALCTRAGNPLLIDLQPFVDRGVFSSRELSRMDWGRDRAKISYPKVMAAKYKALEMVFDALGSLPDPGFDRFREDNRDWLEDYALFAAIYEQFQYLPLPLWGDGVARRSHAELDRLRIRLDRRIRFYEYLQYLFYGQWGQLRRYAAQKGVRLMGSMTFELPETSVELWTDPAANDVSFRDAFADRWKQRLAWSRRLYDITKVYRRVDGEEVFAFYEPTWVTADDFCETLLQIGRASAGDLAAAGRYTHAFQKGFGERAAARHLPHWYDRTAIAYVGTCSDDTIRGWIKTLDKATAQDVNEYIGTALPRDQAWSVLRTMWLSQAAIVLSPVQDFLELGSSSRLSGFENPADNWTWRLRRGSLTNRLAQRIARMNRLFDRGGRQ